MDEMPFHPLRVPAQAVEHGGEEILRAVIAKGGLYLSLKRAFDDPEGWGRALAEVVKHVAQVYANETRYSKETAASRIIETFAQEMASDKPAAGVSTPNRQ
ncbi:MAG: DUF5076 domain-containing protein [Xanthobacteraceae bacterium]|jgi:hypothetical protein